MCLKFKIILQKNIISKKNAKKRQINNTLFIPHQCVREKNTKLGLFWWSDKTPTTWKGHQKREGRQKLYFLQCRLCSVKELRKANKEEKYRKITSFNAEISINI